MKHGMKEPFPSSPQRQPEVCLYVYKRYDVDNDWHLLWACPCMMYSGRHIVEWFMDEALDKGTWLDDETLVLSYEGFSVKIKNAGMVLEYEWANGAERDWVVHDHKGLGMRRILHSPATEVEEEDIRPVVEKREPVVRKRKRKKAEGAMTIAEIADEVGITPNKARMALRKAREPKPEGGWKWDADEVPRIKKIIAG